MAPGLLLPVIAADIGGPDVQELWVMDSFAFALSEGHWSDKSKVNRAVKAIERRDYPSRTEIVIKISIVSLVNFLYDKNKVVPFVPWYNLSTMVQICLWYKI